ncbi:MAG: hypothetical protein NTV93_04855 [Verrucomicrobia bacterium]|nr:hypothetical protein [Verrucomicrobiota bacterium]
MAYSSNQGYGACSRINTKALLGSDVQEGNLKMIPRPEGSPDPVPERAQRLKACEAWTNKKASVLTERHPQLAGAVAGW